jgi:hypothetical protein
MKPRFLRMRKKCRAVIVVSRSPVHPRSAFAPKEFSSYRPNSYSPRQATEGMLAGW